MLLKTYLKIIRRFNQTIKNQSEDSGACTIKLFTAVIVVVSLQARAFATSTHLRLSLKHLGKARAYQRGAS
jgi:hypothetical protein